jgi:hypothetical protein
LRLPFASQTQEPENGCPALNFWNSLPARSFTHEEGILESRKA